MQKENILIIHDVRSTQNVGAMFRTADAVGVSKIYLTGYTPMPVDRFGRKRRDVAKSALGAEEYVKWEHKKNLLALVSKLKEEKFLVVAIEQDKNSIDYKEFSKQKNFKNWKEGYAFIVGSEVGGIPKKVLNKCDVVVEIPMRGKKESLNVSVAMGITLYRILDK